MPNRILFAVLALCLSAWSIPIPVAPKKPAAPQPTSNGVAKPKVVVKTKIKIVNQDPDGDGLIAPRDKCPDDYAETNDGCPERPLSNTSKFGSLYDSRDGKSYKTLKVGSQVWMAENLNFGASSSWCYDDETSNCEKYGRLYDWNAALEACPRGWHLPSDMEWTNLGNSLRGKGLADASWYGDNSSGFGALPAGCRSTDGYFNYLGSDAYFWSSTPNGESYAWSRSLGKGYAEFGRNLNYDGRSNAHSVRCLQD